MKKFSGVSFAIVAVTLFGVPAPSSATPLTINAAAAAESVKSAATPVSEVYVRPTYARRTFRVVRPTVYVRPRYVRPTVYLRPAYVRPTVYLRPTYVRPTVYLRPNYVRPTVFSGRTM